MPSALLRIVAAVLVPCLMADPVTASALASNRQTKATPAIGSALLAEQALIAHLLWAPPRKHRLEPAYSVRQRAKHLRIFRRLGAVSLLTSILVNPIAARAPVRFAPSL